MIKFKAYSVMLLLAASLPVGAQQPSGMSEEDMQQAMQGMMQMASCFQNIDQERLAALTEEAEGLESDLKQLCAAGERDEAQQKAMAFGLRFAQSEEMQQLQQCGEAAHEMLAAIPDYSSYQDDDDSSRHVCDEI